jgi:hypothetical protein
MPISPCYKKFVIDIIMGINKDEPGIAVMMTVIEDGDGYIDELSREVDKFAESCDPNFPVYIYQGMTNVREVGKMYLQSLSV